MKAMSTDYLESGRTRQKQRTRDQLIAAARELITAGDTPRVEEVAEAAGISRPTAYRYFASRAELLAAAYPERIDRAVLVNCPYYPDRGVSETAHASLRAGLRPRTH